MIKSCSLALLFSLTLQALFPAFPAFSQEEEIINSANALNRLIEISDQLSTLNARLRNELADSRQNSRELQSMLEASKRELDGLRQELEALRNVSTELSNRAELSAMESTALLSALKKAEFSLVSLEQSFTAYRTASDQRIKDLQSRNNFWKIGCIAFGIIAAGLGVTLILSR